MSSPFQCYGVDYFVSNSDHAAKGMTELMNYHLILQTQVIKINCTATIITSFYKKKIKETDAHTLVNEKHNNKKNNIETCHTYKFLTALC
jgi:hypothetical protein